MEEIFLDFMKLSSKSDSLWTIQKLWLETFIRNEERIFFFSWMSLFLGQLVILQLGYILIIELVV